MNNRKNKRSNRTQLDYNLGFKLAVINEVAELLYDDNDYLFENGESDKAKNSA